MRSRPVFVVVMVASALVVAGCGVHVRARSDSTSRTSTAPSVGEVSSRAGRRCRFQSAFEALAELSGGSVVCPTWLPGGLRATALTVGNSEQVSSDQIVLSGLRWMVTVGPPASGSSPPSRPILRVRLSDGSRVLLRAAGDRFFVVAHLPGAAGGQEIAVMALAASHVSRSVALATAKRVVDSLRALPSDIIGGHPPCQYPAVFAAVAMIAGAKTAMCPRWLSSSVAPERASAEPLDEYNPVEFQGALGNGLYPHVVFEWVTHAPPGRPLRRMRLGNGRRVPVYFQPPGVALNSDHLIVIFSSRSSGPRFWVSLHDSYGSRRATEAVLRRIVDSLEPLNPLSGRAAP